MVDAPRTARARARAELTAEIKRAARDQLAEVGAAALSVRAVARELGMASSAVYRYFPGRDDLLTALIFDAYSDVADVADTSIASSGESPLEQRWLLLTGAIRSWAVEHPHEYALIYGSPVPGYAAPIDTTEPAQRLTTSMLSLLVDALATTDQTGRGQSSAELDPATALALEQIRAIGSENMSDHLLQAAVSAWMQLFGHLSFELFGHLHNVVDDYEAFFEAQMLRAIEPAAEFIGLERRPPAESPPTESTSK